MKKKIDYFLDALDNPEAPMFLQLASGFVWLLIIAAFSAICLFFAYVFS